MNRQIVGFEILEIFLSKTLERPHITTYQCMQKKKKKKPHSKPQTYFKKKTSQPLQALY